MKKLFSIFFVLALMWSGNVWAATYNLSFSWTADKVTTSPGNGSYYVYWYDSSGNGDELYQITLNKGYVANGGYVTSNPAITFYLIYDTDATNYGNITLPPVGTYTVNTDKSTHGGKQIIDYGTVTRKGKSTYYQTYSYYSAGYYDDTWGSQYYGTQSLNSKAWYSSVSGGSSTFTSGSITLSAGSDGYPYITGTLTTADGNTVNVTIGSAPSYSAGTITAVPNNASYGSVTGTAGASTFVSGTNYAGGTSVSLTATPNTGYYFSQWSDGTTANPYNITVNGNKSVTAQFTAYGNGGSLGTKTWSCNNSSEGQSSVLQTISSTDIYNIYYTSNGYNPAIQIELLIPTGSRKLYSGYYGAPAGTYNVWYDNTAGAAQVPSHEGECLGSVQNGAVVSRYYDNSGNAYIFYSGTVTVEPGVAGLYYKFVGKVLRNNTLYDLTATIGTRNTSADEIGRNYTITDCLVKRTSTNNCFDICIYGNHPYTGTEGGVIQLKNVNLGSNTSIAGAHTFTASYSNCDNSGQWFAEEGYTSSNGTDYIDNPSGTITFTWVGTDGSGNPRYTIDISSCHGYYYNSSVISGGYCFNTRDEINQYGYTFSKTMSVRAQNSDGTSLTLTDATTYTVTYNAGTYGTGDAIANDTKTGGEDLTLSSSTYTRTGYTQTGWSVDADGSTNDYALGGTYSTDADLDLYPYWTELVTFTIASYSNGTVTVTPNDGSGAFTSGSRDLAVGTVVTFSAVASPNYHITNVNLNIKESDNSFSTTSAYTLKTGDGTVTLTANFLPDTYAITYNAGANGTGTIAAGEKTYNVNFTLSNSTFTRTGYTQTGWSINADGSSNDYTLGGTYTGNTALDLYPYWEVNSYTLTWTTDGDALTGTYTSGTVAYGTPIVQPNTPTKASTVQYAYTFNGWDPTPAETMPAAPTTYTATWTQTLRQYALNVVAGANGTVNGGGTYDYGTDVEITATPNTGYRFVKWSDDNTANPRTIHVTDLTAAVTYTATFESDVTPEIVLNEEGGQHTLGGVATNKTLDDLASDYASRDVNVTIDRTLYGGSWNTIVFPFGLENLDVEGNELYDILRNSLYELQPSTTTATADGMIINFLPLSYEDGDMPLKAGKPYLIRTSAEVNLNSYPFNGVHLTSEFSSVTDGDAVDFVPIKEKEKINYDAANLAIFIVGNRLYYPNKTTGTNLRGFRAYLKIKNGTVYGGPVRIRIADTGETITLDEEQEIETRKYVEDGILIIERGGVRYDAQGKRME